MLMPTARAGTFLPRLKPGDARAPAMARPATWLLLVPYVALSSYLGLSGRFGVVWDPLGAIAFMGAVWSWSVAADVLFVAGSVATAIYAARLALAKRRLASVGLALAGTWATYVASFLVLTTSDGLRAMRIGNVGLGTIWFVTLWGIVGIVFGALAPVLAVRWWARRADAQPDDAAPS